MSSTIQPAPLMTRLNLEWSTTHAPREHYFGALGIRLCGELLEEIHQVHRAARSKQISSSDRDAYLAEEDAILIELISLAHTGDRIAERTLVQLLLPAAQRMAHRVRSLGDMDRADRVGYAISMAWEMISQYKLHLRRRVHANLTMGLLRLLSPKKTQNDLVVANCTTPVSDDVLEAVAGGWSGPEQPIEVLAVRLFSWGVDNGIVTREETALLARVTLGEEKQTDIAQELGVSVDCINQRIKRSRQRLRVAFGEIL
ncbi:hypothetical protein [Microbacterium sp. Be9]|uniref:hypothetical protein n=1 Tax=Microbacterium sp. Be9 TaxID=2720211 RepID=UPI0014247AFE|nr:hypothetical protein [Microbacterium sp. Be9]NIG66732.1 hypothetical protein [Microbacterium sp. Be9]